METSYMNCISIKGLLTNLLNDEFTTRDCIGEMLDNCIGANAKNINIILDSYTDTLIFSDDGDGMTKIELGEAHILHNRKPTSVSKDGRFGIGGKHARSHFTRNTNIVKTISKSSINDNNIYDGIFEIEIDYLYSVKNNSLTLNPTDISMKSSKLWDIYSIDKHTKGTITYIKCHSAITKKIYTMITTDNIQKNLAYYIATTYNDTIALGTNIKLINITENVDNPIEPIQSIQEENKQSIRQSISQFIYKTNPIEPIDPIYWNTIPNTDKDETIIEIYLCNTLGKPLHNSIPKLETHIHTNVNTDTNTDTNNLDNIRCCFIEKGELVYRENINSSRGKSIVMDICDMSTKIGIISCKSVYSNDWRKTKKDKLLTLKIADNIPDIPTFDDEITGKFIKRNNKIIKRFTIDKAVSGDKCKYSFYTNTIHLIKFDASNSLDKLFNVNINKSRLDEHKIHKLVNNTIKYLRQKFINNIHKQHCNTCNGIVYNNGITRGITRIIEPFPEPKPSLENSLPKPSLEQKTHKPIILIELKTITFSKTATSIIICDKKKKICEIPYYCQYNIVESYFIQTLENVGQEKFRKWIIEQAKISKLIE